MMDDLKRGRINCVIVKDISRLGRHFVLTSELVERVFPEMKVRLICIDDNYDSDNIDADSLALTMPLKMVMNDYYVKDISRKIRSSISTKMINGEYLLRYPVFLMVISGTRMRLRMTLILKRLMW